MSADSYFMKRALVLARRGLGDVYPNPMVGAVVVQPDPSGRTLGKIVGQGFHNRYGEAHAEVNALQVAGAAAKDATIYVTLEPCNHHGRTPPCVDAILAAGIKRGVIACADPNPNVSGGGAAALEAKGVQVSLGCEKILGEKLLGPWLHRMKTGKEFIALAIARSLDGKIYSHPDEWKSLLSQPALRLLARQSKFFQREGRLIVESPSAIDEHQADALFVYNLPTFLGADGVPFPSGIAAGGISGKGSNYRLNLDFSQKLGQTVFARYFYRSF